MVVAALFLSILGQPSSYAVPGRNKEKEEKLTARIQEEKSPGKKARLQLRLAKLKLREADEAYHSRDFSQGKGLLQQYLEQVRNSWATLQGATDGIKKHMRAFKDLEISLRENDRFLEDLRHRVPYPESETVKKIAKESGVVHDEVLDAIFPSGLPPKRRKKRLLPPMSSMPVTAGAVES